MNLYLFIFILCQDKHFLCEISTSRLFSFFNFKVFNILFKDRVTKPQKKMLISLLRETKFMEGKKEKEWYWEKIQAALNSIGPKKTIIQWKKVSGKPEQYMYLNKCKIISREFA